jgi:hypothetical protein
MKSINELKEDFLLILSMPSAPDFCKVKLDHVFDEDRSVRWNREEAIRVNSEYDAKCKILCKKKTEAVIQVTDCIKRHISIYVGCSLQRASLIWNFVYDHYRSDIDELFNKLEEFEVLFGNYERID